MYVKSLLFCAAMTVFYFLPANAQPKFIHQDYIDHSIKPGDDFYSYANGNWLKNNEIPATESSWGSWGILTKEIRHRLVDLTKETASKKYSHGSIEQKLGSFFRSGMDTLAIDRLGIQPLQSFLEQIANIKDINGIIENVVAQYSMGLNSVPPLFVMGNLADPIANDVEIITFSQGGMGLPEKSYYFDKDEKSVIIRNKYQIYLQQLFQLSGVSVQEATSKASQVIDLETRLAKGARTATENRNIPRLLNYYTIDKLNKQFPLISWNDFFHKLNIPETKIIVGQPEFFDSLNVELTATPLSTWKDYLKVRLLSNASRYLSAPFEKASFGFYNTVLGGQTQLRPRMDRVIDITDNLLGEMLGKLYVGKYFSPAAKEKISILVQNILSTFGERIQSNDWMTDSTKKKALEKLASVRTKIAYPDKWRDYSTLVIGNHFFENAKAASAFNFRYNMDKVGKPVDRDAWNMTAPTINAYYNPLNNEIVFPAGILVSPFFDANADDAVNYGGIATVIGHEISHGFDDQGSQFDASGRFHNWWTKKDKENFEKRGTALVNQFDHYIVLDSMHVNGELTLGENIGDLCGVTVAYQAFKKTDEGKSNKLIDGLTPDQRFFLSYASIWLDKERPESLRTQILTDPHSPVRFRVNGPLSNLESFYKAFDVKEGDKMWRPASDRVTIW